MGIHSQVFSVHRESPILRLSPFPPLSEKEEDAESIHQSQATETPGESSVGCGAPATSIRVLPLAGWWDTCAVFELMPVSRLQEESLGGVHPDEGGCGGFSLPEHETTSCLEGAEGRMLLIEALTIFTEGMTRFLHRSPKT